MCYVYVTVCVLFTSSVLYKLDSVHNYHNVILRQKRFIHTCRSNICRFSTFFGKYKRIWVGRFSGSGADDHQLMALGEEVWNGS